ncbi:hypothetical protein OGATHE_003403 [Ogataea polymorpha]|uniref:Uncharacterized protein n=1 Tax=Ogataea polymorpha TaxID=460523 RepID=A0A9P8P2X9_9ASCO|nr:hypothetical protein OGATHE_003403 [Ogataea polymorpha]
MWTNPIKMESFILYELVKSKLFSVPCHAGSRPNGYTPVCVPAMVSPSFHDSGHFQPDLKNVVESENTSLYRNPVYIEKNPIMSRMYLPEYAMSKISSLFNLAIFFSLRTSARAAKNMINPCPRSPNMMANMNGKVATVGRPGFTSLYVATPKRLLGTAGIFGGDFLQHALHLVEIVARHPSFSNKTPSGLIVVAQVHDRVHRFLQLHGFPPKIQLGSDSAQLCLERQFGRLQHVCHIRKLVVDLTHLLGPSFDFLVHKVQVCIQRFTDFAHTRQNELTVCKNDETVFVDVVFRLDVVESLTYFGRSNEKIAAENTPQDSLQDFHLGSRNHSCDEIGVANSSVLQKLRLAQIDQVRGLHMLEILVRGRQHLLVLFQVHLLFEQILRGVAQLADSVFQKLCILHNLVQLASGEGLGRRFLRQETTKSATMSALDPIHSRISAIKSHQSQLRVIDATQAAGDEDLLKEIGYKQELNRKFKTYQIFGIAYSVMGILPGVASVSSIGLAGGPAAFVWGWFITSIMILTIAVAMSENGK